MMSFIDNSFYLWDTWKMAERDEESKGIVAYNTPVPAELDELVRSRMAEAGFNSKAEYVRSLMRADVELSSQQRLEAKLVRALERGNFSEATPEFWERLRTEVLREG